MAPYSVMVTGANRGIGLGLVKEFLKNSSIHTVIATARNPNSAKGLNDIKDRRLKTIKLDVTNDDSIKNAYTQVRKCYGYRVKQSYRQRETKKLQPPNENGEVHSDSYHSPQQ
ncbi:unnamed protein product [Heligmosomoides polygyrus]|uniref:KR domain-containing protein n=1 Tax=Heligmosomoides polygyrus TaxID=6339 RepID=A0A183FJC1_HELPZ|nr:unnamed protein product [Heligmosomoides polygyrus]